MAYSGGRFSARDIQFQYDGPLGPVVLLPLQTVSAGRMVVRFFMPARRHRQFHAVVDRRRPAKRIRFPARANNRGFCGPLRPSQLYSRVDAIPPFWRLRVGALETPLGKVALQHVHRSSAVRLVSESPIRYQQFDKTERTKRFPTELV